MLRIQLEPVVEFQHHRLLLPCLYQGHVLRLQLRRRPHPLRLLRQVQRSALRVVDRGHFQRARGAVLAFDLLPAVRAGRRRVALPLVLAPGDGAADFVMPDAERVNVHLAEPPPVVLVASLARHQSALGLLLVVRQGRARLALAPGVVRRRGLRLAPQHRLFAELQNVLRSPGDIDPHPAEHTGAELGVDVVRRGLTAGGTPVEERSKTRKRGAKRRVDVSMSHEEGPAQETKCVFMCVCARVRVCVCACVRVCVCVTVCNSYGAKARNRLSSVVGGGVGADQGGRC